MPQNTAETAANTAETLGCLYDEAGKLCGDSIRARGYCRKHYSLLSRKGAFKANSSPGSDIERNMGHLARARAKLEAHTETLVDCIVDAAKVAAKKGDSKPAEWALLHARALEPVAAGKSGPGADTQGVRVLIGVQLGSGVPDSGEGRQSRDTVRTVTIESAAVPSVQPALVSSN